MNLRVVRRLLNSLLFLMMTSSVFSSEDRYELNNAVIGDVVRTMENKNTEAILSDQQILEMYPDLNLTISRTKGPPVSIMSGKIPDHLIRRMADYLFGLLQGTGEVIKPTTTTTTTTTTPSSSSSSSTTSSPPPSPPPPEFLPFRAASNDLAVHRDVPKTAESLNFGTAIRRKPIRKTTGVSRRKSEKLWRKTRMVKTIGMA
uniref:Plug domain-containing protein n=1 Tax=Caenorhabditis tropicalis TaxID=1561998 RepID=A0A1I7V1G5_9PELO